MFSHHIYFFIMIFKDPNHVVIVHVHVSFILFWQYHFAGNIKIYVYLKFEKEHWQWFRLNSAYILPGGKKI